MLEAPLECWKDVAPARHYERLGVPSYWVLDPVQPGGIEVFELSGPAQRRRYQLVTAVAGDEVAVAHRPFPVEICPARLLDGLQPG